MARLAKIFTILIVFTIASGAWGAQDAACSQAAVSAVAVELGREIEAARAPFSTEAGAHVFELGTGSQATVYRVTLAGVSVIKKHYSSLMILEDDTARMTFLSANVPVASFAVSKVTGVRGQIMSLEDTRGRSLAALLLDVTVNESVKVQLRALYLEKLESLGTIAAGFSDETDPTGLPQRYFSRQGVRINIKPENILVGPDFRMTIIDPI
jgi:hypothetical protein